jgi:hypothetical protein
MTLQSSPPISISDIKAEFGVSGSYSIRDFYRGAGIVPNTPANANVPTSGAISVLDFLGASNQSVSLSNDVITATSISPADATSIYQLNANGLIQGIRNGSTATEGTWLLGGTASAFEVRATLQSGSLDGGSTGVWMNLGSTRNWQRNNSNNASSTTSAVIFVEIRDVATQTVLTSATITLQAVVDI